MRCLTACTLLLIVAVHSAISVNEWEIFKMQFSKKYLHKDEEAFRRSIWEKNVMKIDTHNKDALIGKHTYTLKMNEFGDLSHEEFKRMKNGFNMSMKAMKPESERQYFKAPEGIKIPDSVDWRTQGYVTPIKNQGQCGSCWAFSAVASLEGQHFKTAGKLVSLSEQNLVDCSDKQGNMGCNGGLMDQAFQYIISNHGIDTEDSYPYEGVDGKCRFKAANIGATEASFVDIKSGSEDDLTNALATIGPIASAMDASQESFQFYSSGLYYEPACSSTQLDHGVTPVGYGSMGQGKDYYIVKNMWGTSWGMSGYVLMARNKANNCGIATAASYPTI